VKRILLLGGIGEAIQLAKRLCQRYAITYSLAGRGRTPELPCPVRVGSFGGVEGLTAFLKTGHFDLLIDATHPYAARITQHADLAAKQVGIPLWAYRRPLWTPSAGDDWRVAKDWAEILLALNGFRHPFFTLGLEPLAHVADIPITQHWLVRCLAKEPLTAAKLTVLQALGPFSVAEEAKLMRSHGIDVLVSKNSGGSAVAAKLTAARQLQIPVVMLARPPLPPADREFRDIWDLAAQLGCSKHNLQ
jgi:precorrin-6A/cobalt-precorrin-6A reductase